MRPQLVLGTHTYAASGDALRRQENGLATLRALSDVEPVNVQFARGAHEAQGVRTLAALYRDSNTVTGRRGPRKPIVADIFNSVFREAERRRAPYFGFMNADILVSQEAVDQALRDEREACILSREDFDGRTGAPKGIGVYGADLFIVATNWWPAHSRRFRGYVLGEAVWDNVYAAVLMCHARAAIENRRPLLRHEAHAQTWTTDGPFADYQRLLAARDATYFTLWCEYVDAVLRVRQHGGSADDEDEVGRRSFRWPPARRARVVQSLRTLKALLRYRAARLRWTMTLSPR